MKVAVKNFDKKPINIARLAPLMPVQVLGVNQTIIVNIKDIDSVMKKAVEIGVTVTPMEAFEVTSVVEPKVVETPSVNLVETDKTETIIESVVETPTETNEVTPEMVEPSEDNKVVEDTILDKLLVKEKETKPKKKTTRKSTKAKKTTTK